MIQLEPYIPIVATIVVVVVGVCVVSFVNSRRDNKSNPQYAAIRCNGQQILPPPRLRASRRLIKCAISSLARRSCHARNDVSCREESYYVVLAPSDWIFGFGSDTDGNMDPQSHLNQEAAEVARLIRRRLGTKSLQFRLYCAQMFLAFPPFLASSIWCIAATPWELCHFFYESAIETYATEGDSRQSPELPANCAWLFSRLGWPWEISGFTERFRDRLSDRLNCGIIAPPTPFQLVGAAMAYIPIQNTKSIRHLLVLEPALIHPTRKTMRGLFWHDAAVTVDHEIVHCGQNDLLQTFDAEFAAGFCPISPGRVLAFLQTMLLEAHACAFGNFPNPVFLIPSFIVCTFATFTYHRVANGTYIAGFDTMLLLSLLTFLYGMFFIVSRLIIDFFLKTDSPNQ